jgi:hypothetical protein
MQSLLRNARLAVFLLAGCLLAASSDGAIHQALSGHVRQFDNHRHFDDRPFAKDDFGYGLSYAVGDDKGRWQLGSLYTPDAGKGDTELDYALTPFLNLVFKDKYFLVGMGISQTFMSAKEGDDDWTDLYWNVLTGLEFPVTKRISLAGLAIYDYEEWGKLGDFAFDDVEFAAVLNLLF